MSAKRLLPPEVFDYLHLVSLDVGGVGGDKFRDSDMKARCLGGYATDANDEAVNTALCDALGSIANANDTAVASINRRRGRASYARVPFLDLVAELNIDVAES